MGTLQGNYLAAYRSLKLTRDAGGVLIAEFHTKGGPFTFTAPDHTEWIIARRSIRGRPRDIDAGKKVSLAAALGKVGISFTGHRGPLYVFPLESRDF